MSLHRRLTTLVAAAVAVAVAIVSVLAYTATRRELRGQVDRSLREQARVAALAGPADVILPAPTGRVPVREPVAFEAPQLIFFQLVRSDGSAQREPAGEIAIPVTDVDVAVAAGTRGSTLRDVHVAGQHLRLLTVPARPGLAIQLARPLDEVDRTLARLGTLLALVAVAGAAMAALAGRVVTRAGLAPVDRLTEAAEHVATTQRLDARIPVTGGDEVARLGSTLNAMLSALAESRASQQRLVDDAAHELRTPLTSLRTNAELLALAERSPGRLPAPARDELVTDLVAQADELGTLVNDLVEISRGRGDEPAVRVNLTAVAQAAVDRVRRRAKDVSFDTALAACSVEGRPEQLERAIANVLQNAASWSPPGGTVTVRLSSEGTLSVADEGPGIADEDLPHVFERFYRGAAARGRPGSGLGLAIVREAVERHGGQVRAECGPEGGATITLQLPATS